MRYISLSLGVVTALFVIGCGSGGGGVNVQTPSETAYDVRVSGSYIVNATVKSGNDTAEEIPSNGSGWYRFSQQPSQPFVVTGGVNDIAAANGKADVGEPYAPEFKAPSGYHNITPFTTLLIELGSTAMAQQFPNAYAYQNDFDFDAVKASTSNLNIAKETAKAALMLSSPNEVANAVNLRIINGNVVSSSDNTWKFIISLRVYGSLICGGSLIAPQWVLTASHCVVDSNPNYLPNSIMANSYSLDVGGEIHQIDQLIPHPFYNDATVNNDIALVHLKTPVTSVTPIPLYRGSMLATGTLTHVAGWGDTDEDQYANNYPSNLNEVTLPVIDFDTCNASYAYGLTSNMFCAGYMDGSKDSCQGDSGGPAITQNNGQNELAGIVSFGGSEDQWCGAPGYPGVYTRVNNYIDWIESYTTSSFSVQSSSSSAVSSTQSSMAAVSSSSSISYVQSSSASYSSFSPGQGSGGGGNVIHTLEKAFEAIDAATTLNAINQIVIDYMGYYNGTYQG